MAEKAKVIKKKSASPVPKAQPEADLKALLTAKLLHNFSVQPESATNEHFYNALVLVLRDMMRARRVEYIGEAHRQQSKQVYYLCMEFLMGRSLKNTLYNLNLTEEARQVLDGFHVKLDALFELEPDAGLGNGGLGRLAACFLDGLATAAIPAVGYSLLYEYGIFRQKLVDGWQTELPDFWLPGGESWLLPRPELAKEVRFDGNIREWWDDNGFHHVVHDNANIVIAQPYDLMVAGKDGRGVSTLRLWRSTAPGMNMSLFNQGEYMRAMEQKAMAEVITQVLYPADNHREGKSLRLSQQYFLVSASVQDIVRRHLEQFGTLDNLPDNAAVHINDTHPTLAIPELIRIMLDECGYSWDAAWDLVTRTVAYTNHTVMAEALERFAAIKRENKARLSDYVKKTAGVSIDPDSLFDVQVKRLHEYKRQHLNALHILHTYLQLKDNPHMDFVPRTYLFGAKSAPGYYLAKEIIRFICNLAKEIDSDPAVRDKLKVVYLEDYRVTLAEMLMPAADISEQISLAGTEASGTGNMKLMMNGAVTLGTMDGANVEIYDAVGPDNIFIFGMSTEEVEALKKQGYQPQSLYTGNPHIHRAIDAMYAGFGGHTYGEIAGSLTSKDPYMVLADFEDYLRAQNLSAETYRDKEKWARMALLNTAGSGVFASDRSIRDYSDRIWHCRPVK